jgi:four helix bundle protein
MFPHARLDAYHAAAEFVVLADGICLDLPRGRAYLVDQLRRASTSVQLNIAEGAGEYSPADKAKYYRIALRSATECAGALDVCDQLRLCAPARVAQARAVLSRVVAMTTRLVQRFGGVGNG